ncbi:hypothetical protein ACOSQ3_032610 [Xanthoceras sorbifolium]
MGDSSSTRSHGRKYDVFVSFRVEDTSNSFTSHLCRALSQKHIETFVDDGGDENSPALLKAIELSKISLVIFSRHYASSDGCLRQLAEIIKLKKLNEQIVIPVFYQVDPSHVRKQTGSFKGAFVRHNKEWRDALTQASNLSGFHSSVIRPESRLVDEIVKDVLKKLNDMSPSSGFRGLVGIDSRIQKVKSLLCMEMLDFRVVGIWGMGGVGKTTIAAAVFDQISCQFEGCCCFIANVRETSERCGGLVRLRDKVLSKILEENLNLGTPNIPPFIKRRLQRKKVFIVLDDVDSLQQLEVLAGGLDGFGPGSRIIITTRDKQLLLNFRAAYNIYEAEALDKHEALQLFCKCAFKEDHHRKDLMVFAHRVVDYAKGNPLALKVVGSSLYRKSKQDWESALHKLNKISNPEIHNILSIGYDGLDREEKNILLDIGCFFKGENRDYVIQILNGCYLSAQAGLSVLVDKSLITISPNRIEMHDLLQEMCWEIVRLESFNKPGERSRLCNHEDACLVLRRNTGTEAVKGISLDMSKMKNINVSSQTFEKMCNLRFLKLYDWTRSFGDSTNICKVHLPNGLNYLPNGLRYFHWDGYPSKVLPSNLSLENLVELNLFDSNVEGLWEGKKHIPTLRRLILGHSRLLTTIPDLSGSPYLEVIDLVECKSLLDISCSIQHLNNLKHLRLVGCESLRSFSRNIHFKSLRNLDVTSCINLMKFPQISGNIEMLTLTGTEIEEVPASVESLSKLFLLDLSDCARLKHISTSICKLKSLRVLSLKNCPKLESFPEILEIMESLEELDLSGTAIKELPFSIEHLNGLLRLLLNCCKNLETLPSSICNLTSLIEFDLSDCPKLGKLPVNMGSLKSFENISAAVSQPPSSMTSLRSLIECLAFHPISGLSCSLEDLCLNNSSLMEIPKDIGCLSSLKKLELCKNDFESLPTSIKQLSKLETLLLNDCNMLRFITKLPSNLLLLEAMNCKQLQSLPDTSEFTEFLTSERSISRNARLTKLDFIFTNSLKLNERAFSHVFAESLLIIQRMATAGKKHQKDVRLSICYPGSEIPNWFSYQSSGSFVNIQLPPHNWCGSKLLGFALCAVLAFEEYCYDEDFSVAVPYMCCFKTNYGDRITFKGKLTVRAHREFEDKIFIDSDHIVLGYDDYSHVKLRDDLTTCSVEFWSPYMSPNCKVKYCGVCPIYVEPVGMRKFPNEADTSRSGSGRFDDEKIDPQPKIISEKKLTFFINHNVISFYRSLRSRVGLLFCYCWIFLVCLCGLFVFGMLGFLVLHPSINSL